jgi:hypothetical protein
MDMFLRRGRALIPSRRWIPMSWKVGYPLVAWYSFSWCFKRCYNRFWLTLFVFLLQNCRQDVE